MFQIEYKKVINFFKDCDSYIGKKDDLYIYSNGKFTYYFKDWYLYEDKYKPSSKYLNYLSYINHEKKYREKSISEDEYEYLNCQHFSILNNEGLIDF